MSKTSNLWPSHNGQSEKTRSAMVTLLQQQLTDATDLGLQAIRAAGMEAVDVRELLNGSDR